MTPEQIVDRLMIAFFWGFSAMSFLSWFLENGSTPLGKAFSLISGAILVARLIWLLMR